MSRMKTKNFWSTNYISRLLAVYVRTRKKRLRYECLMYFFSLSHDSIVWFHLWKTMRFLSWANQVEAKYWCCAPQIGLLNVKFLSAQLNYSWSFQFCCLPHRLLKTYHALLTDHQNVSQNAPLYPVHPTPTSCMTSPRPIQSLCNSHGTACSLRSSRQNEVYIIQNSCLYRQN